LLSQFSRHPRSNFIASRAREGAAAPRGGGPSSDSRGPAARGAACDRAGCERVGGRGNGRPRRPEHVAPSAVATPRNQRRADGESRESGAALTLRSRGATFRERRPTARLMPGRAEVASFRCLTIFLCFVSLPTRPRCSGSSAEEPRPTFRRRPAHRPGCTAHELRVQPMSFLPRVGGGPWAGGWLPGWVGGTFSRMEDTCLTPRGSRAVAGRPARGMGGGSAGSEGAHDRSGGGREGGERGGVRRSGSARRRPRRRARTARGVVCVKFCNFGLDGSEELPLTWFVVGAVGAVGNAERFPRAVGRRVSGFP
jgi:hypothetical protein